MRFGVDSAPGVRYDDVLIATAGRDTLHCLVRAPSGLMPGERRPGVVLAGGQRTGRRAVTLLGKGFAGVAIACDYPWAPRLRKPWPLLVISFPSLRAQILATPGILHLASSALRVRLDVDTARIAGIGASLGVPPVAAWSAADRHVDAVALVYGGGLIERQIEILATEGNLWPWLSRLLGRLGGAWFRELEPTRTAPLIAPRPLLVIGSRTDQRIPMETVQALYDAAREPKRIIWLGGAHMRPRDEELLAILADSSLAWLETALPGHWRTERNPTGTSP